MKLYVIEGKQEWEDRGHQGTHAWTVGHFVDFDAAKMLLSTLSQLTFKADSLDRSLRAYTFSVTRLGDYRSGPTVNGISASIVQSNEYQKINTNLQSVLTQLKMLDYNMTKYQFNNLAYAMNFIETAD